MKLFCYNKLAINITRNSFQYDMTKVDQFFIQEEADSGWITTVHIPFWAPIGGCLNVFTKGLLI